MAANTTEASNNLTANPAFLAALNNNVIDINEPNPDNASQSNLPSKAIQYLGTLCTCQGLLRSFTFYYLTLNILLLILVLVYDDTSSRIWWVGFLLAVVLNIVLCVGILTLICYSDKSLIDGDMGAAPISMVPDEDKSSSFKTVLTINSKTVPLSTIKGPAASDATNITIQKQVAPEQGFANLTPQNQSGEKDESPKKKGKKGANKDGKHKKDKAKKGSREKLGTAKETNFAAIPSNVLATSGKREDNVKKKKKTKPDKNKKKR